MQLFDSIRSAVTGFIESLKSHAKAIESHVHSAVTFSTDEIKAAELAFIHAETDPTVVTLSQAFEAGVAFAVQRAKEAATEAASMEVSADEGPVGTTAEQPAALETADPAPTPVEVKQDPATVAEKAPDADPTPAQ